jgi:hypothetical protein
MRHFIFAATLVLLASIGLAYPSAIGAVALSAVLAIVLWIYFAIRPDLPASGPGYFVAAGADESNLALQSIGGAPFCADAGCASGTLSCHVGDVGGDHG